MTTTSSRFSSLYPLLFRPSTAAAGSGISRPLLEAATAAAALQRPPPRASFASTVRRRRTELVSRYGNAAREPPLLPSSSPPHLAGMGARLPAPEAEREKLSIERGLPEPDRSIAETPSSGSVAAAVGGVAPLGAAASSVGSPLVGSRPTLTVTPSSARAAAQTPESSVGTAQEQARTVDVGAASAPMSPGPASLAAASGDNALTKILSMDPAMARKATPTATAAGHEDESQSGVPLEKPPHMHTPPYVHHFDTYTLVQGLADKQRGGYTEKQAVTVMKAVRGLLAVNMDLARDGLVSKSDLEMVR